MRLLVLATRLRDAALNARVRRGGGLDVLVDAPVALGGAGTGALSARPEAPRFTGRPPFRRPAGPGAAMESDSEIERRCRWSMDFL
jgi:hypothetical protein